MYGIDISNLQGPPDSYRGESWYTDAEFVIVQAIAPPAGYPGSDVGGYTGVQLQAAKDDGKYIGAYVWLWDSVNTVVDIAARLKTIPDSLQLDIRLWLDVEDTGSDIGPSRQQDVLDALGVMDQWATDHGLPPTGIYSGDWYIRGYLNGWFPENRMYWLADYSIQPTLFPSRPVHQFASSPVDRDFMLDSEIITVNPAPPVITVTDCQTYKDAIETAVNRLQIELAKKSLSRKMVAEIQNNLFLSLQN